MATAAHKRGLHVVTCSPGLVSWSTETGACNNTDWLTLLIKGIVELGCAPKANSYFNLIPVDFLASTIVQRALQVMNFLPTEDPQEVDCTVHQHYAPFQQIVNIICTNVAGCEDLSIPVPFEDWKEYAIQQIESLTTPHTIPTITPGTQSPSSTASPAQESHTKSQPEQNSQHTPAPAHTVSPIVPLQLFFSTGIPHDSSYCSPTDLESFRQYFLRLLRFLYGPRVLQPPEQTDGGSDTTTSTHH